MSDKNQDPMIKVLGFKTTYERLPVHGDPLEDNVETIVTTRGEKHFKLDAKGKRIMASQETDWVSYAPAHSPLNTMNWERIRHLEVKPEMLAGETDEKIRLMAVRWSQIEPAYQAWKSGQELPTSGTPLSAWAGVNPEKVEVLRRYGIRTVEEIRDLAESQLERIQLPGMRDMRKAAKLFLENLGAAEAAERETERDNEIAFLKAQLAENNERLSAAMDLLEAQTKPANDADDEVSALRDELDARGIPYHHKAGAEKLRALLSQQAA